ncbi:MAG: hypothetical protein ABSE67_06495 [Xanthobacteraceae bacterium]|jgi:hypothetical protein
MLRRIHPLAGIVAYLTILTFWTSTVVSELFFSVDAVVAVKGAIPWGLLVLVPALAITGATGFRIAGASSQPRIVSKRRRMPFIAGNGILILIPAALGLSVLASHREFDSLFYIIQAIELVAGAGNLVLMSLNIRDGLRLTGRLKEVGILPGRQRAAATSQCRRGDFALPACEGMAVAVSEPAPHDDRDLNRQFTSSVRRTGR